MLVQKRKESTKGSVNRQVGSIEMIFTSALIWDVRNSSAQRGLGWELESGGERQAAGARWSAGGFSALDFITVGNQMEKEGYSEALIWYERAIWLDPYLGDPWYHLGRLYESEMHWFEALEAYREAGDRKRFDQVSPSSPCYQQGLIYQRELPSPQREDAIAAFEKAIFRGSFRNSWEAADAHYRLGVLLRQQETPPEVYVTEFEQAVTLHPQHTMAQALLGTTYYDIYEDVGMAESVIYRALEYNPQNKWVYLHLGDVYRKAGLCASAAEAYRRALAIDPEFDVVLSRQQMVCEEGEH